MWALMESRVRPAAAPVWLVFAASIAVPFAILAVGFRIVYDSVIPEVAALALTGAVFAYVRPRHAWLWIIGIALGIVLSERGFPATPSAEHVARYGPPIKAGFTDFLKLCAIPTAGAFIGLVARLVTDGSLDSLSRTSSR
jgi:hypothetical protein